MEAEHSGRRAIIEKAIERGNGILRLEPAWVARDFLPPGKRLGIPEEQYELGERGGICERWLGSTTRADNRIAVPDEGLSFLNLESKERASLKEAVAVAGATILGKQYAATHTGLGRLAKIFDYQYRLPYHIHHRKEHAALVGRRPKEEAYFFPEGVNMGIEPETYFGVHPAIVEDRQHEILLPYLVDWNSDLILRHAQAYRLVPGDGYHVPAGILHAPGSALTIELQEDSDVFAMLQAFTGGRIICKELLFKDVRPEDRQKHGERFILELVDWETNGDHYFYENRHTPPVLMEQSAQPGSREYWIFYNTSRFSGKKVIVEPGNRRSCVDRGVYNALVWQGKGTYGGVGVEAGNPSSDELLICHDTAVRPLLVENSGSTDLVIYKFFGPDINPDVPMLTRRTIRRS
jgi:hypothetical protein